MLFLGIDGGGTKTEFMLYDENANMLSNAIKESASHWQVRSEKIETVIRSGVDQVLKSAGKREDELTSVGFGMSGYGEDPTMDTASMEICRSIFRGIPLGVCNDVEVGFIAALGLKSGINIVAGTGAMAFGADEEGHTERCGGWGFEIGDEGSGYWLGRKAMELFTKQSDGRLKKTYLYDLIKKRMGVQRDLDIIILYHNEYYSDRTRTASLQAILCEAARAGDVCAVSAYKSAADELIMLAVTLNDKLKFSGKVTVSYTGGVFSSGSFFTEPFIKGLEEKEFVVHPPKFAPSLGAVILAAKQVGWHEDIIRKLDIRRI